MENRRKLNKKIISENVSKREKGKTKEEYKMSKIQMKRFVRDSKRVDDFGRKPNEN